MFDADVIGDNIAETSFLERIYNYYNILLLSVYEISIKELKSIISYFSVHTSFVISDFDEFQLKILKIFVGILLFNITLIFLLWNIYKDRIHERFIKPASSCIIEELKKSVSQLKLPRGHSPRV